MIKENLINKLSQNKLIYKNFFGEYKILISTSKSYQRGETFVSHLDMYEAHIWISDNIVQKSRDESFFKTGDFISDEYIISLFNINIKALIRNDKINKILERKKL